jgi:hypothetical protein
MEKCSGSGHLKVLRLVLACVGGFCILLYAGRVLFTILHNPSAYPYQDPFGWLATLGLFLLLPLLRGTTTKTSGPQMHTDEPDKGNGGGTTNFR